ncbi:MAG: peptidoglycan DD-metalloendopeptidase family protein [bacterium]
MKKNRLLKLFIFILFSLSLTFTIVKISFADESSADVQQKKKQLLEIQQRIKTQQDKIKEIQKQKNTLQTSLDILDAQIEKTKLELQEVETELQETTLKIQDINKQIDAKQKELTEQEALLRYVVRTIYKEGDFSLIESIATSDSLSASISQLGYLDVIKQRKESIIEEIKILKASLEETKQTLEEQKKQSEELREKIINKKTQLDNESLTKTKLLEDTKGMENQYQDMVQADQDESKKIEKDIQNMEAEIARKAKSAEQNQNYQDVKGTGQFIRPVNGPITQNFMERYPDYMLAMYPGLNPYHTGTDFGIPSGTPIKACDDGVVSLVQLSRYGYGNHVILYHGNGLFTLYGHMTAPKVAIDQRVSKGQIIGLSGNSGTSSGPHLHWEVRQYYTDSNGNRKYQLKNPLSYL